MGRTVGKLSVSFACKTCGAKAETIHFSPRGHPSNPCASDAITYNFESETMAISHDEAMRVRQALSAADPGALYSAHHRWLATYCPQCGACYCGMHWDVENWPDPASDWHSMHFDTYGTCPAGHRRLMAKDGLSWPAEE